MTPTPRHQPAYGDGHPWAGETWAGSKVVAPSQSWWLEAPSQGFTARASQELHRMHRDQRFGQGMRRNYGTEELDR